MIAMTEEMDQDAEFNEALSKKVFKALGIDHDKIHECVEDSFTTRGDY